MRGIDISRYNGWPFNSITSAGYKDSDFVIVKATQGRSYDYTSYFTKAIDKVLSDGKLGGAYHYIDGSGAVKQAEYFVSIVKPYIGKIILVVDYESGSNSSWKNTTYVKQFIDKVYELTGVYCILYTGKEGVTYCKNCYPNSKLWFAGYPTNANNWTVPEWPSRYITSPWPKYDIWQFTSSNNALDRNTTSLTKADWVSLAKPKSKTTTTTTAKKEETTVAIDFNKYYNKISNSGHDERGQYNRGAAGDQTGREWEIINWYSRPWTCVLRYPDKSVRQLIAELSIEAANNNKIGYDQYQRNTYWTQLQKAGYRPSKITTACEADCSAGVIANTKAAGHLKNIAALKNLTATYTGNMRTAFKAAGFQVLTDSKYLTNSAYLVPGDILLYDNHHTATNLGIGSKSGYKVTATTTTKPETKPATTTKVTSIPVTTGTYNKIVKATGVINTGLLNIRKGPGKNYSNLVSYPTLRQGTKVGVCDARKATNGTIWYYIKISGNKGDKYGFASASYIKLV